MHWELIGFSATAPGAGGAAAAAYSGDSLVVRNAVAGTKVRLINLWVNKQTAGFVQVTHPSGNDVTRDIRYADQATNPLPMMSYPAVEYMQPQELMSVTIGGSATAGDFEQGILAIWYENSPGLNGRFITPEDVAAQRIRAVTVQGSIAAGAGGGWTGAEALNADSDLLRANTDYAIIGGVIQVRCNALGIIAPDWSNMRLGIPGNATRADLTASFFADLSHSTGLPMIPVFNSANKAGISISAGQDENAAAVPYALNLVELRTPGVNDRDVTP
jgi:hypothetical protein